MDQFDASKKVGDGIGNFAKTAKLQNKVCKRVERKRHVRHTYKHTQTYKPEMVDEMVV